MSRWVIVCAVSGLIACGGAQKSSAKAKVTPCDGAAASVRAVFVQVAAGRDGAPDAAAVEDLIAKHCVADAWSTSAIDCLSAAKDDHGLDACVKQHLSEAQSEAVEHDLDTLLDGGGVKSAAPPDGGGEGGGGGSKGIDGATQTDDPCGGDDGVTHDPCGGGD